MSVISSRSCRRLIPQGHDGMRRLRGTGGFPFARRRREGYSRASVASIESSSG